MSSHFRNWFGFLSFLGLSVAVPYIVFLALPFHFFAAYDHLNHNINESLGNSSTQSTQSQSSQTSTDSIDYQNWKSLQQQKRADKFLRLLSVAAPAISMISFLAPLETVIYAARLHLASTGLGPSKERREGYQPVNQGQGTKDNSTELDSPSIQIPELPCAVFRAQLLCNILSCAYGIQVSNEAILVNNLIGLLFQLMFLCTAFTIERDTAIEKNKIVDDMSQTQQNDAEQVELKVIKDNQRQYEDTDAVADELAKMLDSSNSSLTNSVESLSDHQDNDSVGYHDNDSVPELTAVSDSRQPRSLNLIVTDEASTTNLDSDEAVMTFKARRKAKKDQQNQMIQNQPNRTRSITPSNSNGNNSQSNSKSRVNFESQYNNLTVPPIIPKWSSFLWSYTWKVNLSLFVCAYLLSLSLLSLLILGANVYLAVAPLQKLHTILQTKTRKLLSGPLCVIMILVCGIWSLYGYILEDPVVILPSLLGYILCVFQLAVVLWTYNIFWTDLKFLIRFTGPSRSSTMLKFSNMSGHSNYIRRLSGPSPGPTVSYARRRTNVADSPIKPNKNQIGVNLRDPGLDHNTISLRSADSNPEIVGFNLF